MLRDVLNPFVIFAWLAGSRPMLGVSRSRLAAAQASSLAAMTFCYFLAPQWAWVYAVVAVGGFLALVLPAVMSGPLGVSGQWLVEASPGRKNLPGSTQSIIQSTVTVFPYFAVPAAVAAALPSPVATRSTEPWFAVVALAVMAAVVVGAFRLAGHARKDLACLIVLATAAVMLAAGLVLPGLPGLPALPWG